MTRSAAEIGRGLAAARAARPIRAGERIHVVGAAGAGASAAALLASYAGATASGCDPGGDSPYTPALAARGIPLAGEHSAAHVVAHGQPVVDCLAVTKALTSVAPDHPELAAARAAGVPLEPWQQVVADAAASQGGRLVAVAGTHGKSTSSGWLTHLLAAAGRDPGAFVGALLPAALTGGVAATARWGSGDVFVVEADEYAGNFDAYRPSVAVLLNADWDHPDVFSDEEAVLAAFAAWLRAPGWEERHLVANVGDPGVARLVDRLEPWPAGITRVAAADLKGMELGLIGAHNRANAACVAGAARVLGVADAQIREALRSFGGVGRRLELKGEPQGVAVYDDYGHHPTAIAASLAALRERHPDRRLWAVYEPLTYHRTAQMLDRFAEVLATADRTVIADIWAGRDPDISIASASALAAAIRARGGAPADAPGSVEATAEFLAQHVRPGDVVLVMGGGRSYVIAEQLVERLARQPAGRL